MRKIAKAAAAMMALAISMGSAHAVNLNPRGIGQALIFPYYTVNKGQATLLSIVNTDSVSGKGFVIHFLEGYNGQQVSGLYVFLSPNDVWTGSITQTGADGGAQIASGDHTCTSPALPSAGAPFTTDAYAGNFEVGPDGGPTDVTRTREGSIEVIEIGDIPPATPLYDAILHDQNGQPGAGVPACTAGVVDSASADLQPPSGGLFGSAAIVNVDQGVFFPYNADALSGFTDIALNVPHSTAIPFPPYLPYANSADSSYPGGAKATLLTDDGHAIELDYENSIDAVSAVFMADTLYNEYLADPNLGASTDWIVTFPTKFYYVNGFTADGNAIPPFVEKFSQRAAGQSETEFAANVYDREEGMMPPDIFPEPTSHPTFMAYQTNALTFRPPGDDSPVSSVLGSALLQPDSQFTPLAPYGTGGWARIGLAFGDGGAHVMRPDAGGRVLNGLPVTGFMAYNVVNANAQPGVLANYSGAFPHRSTSTCMNPDSTLCH